MMPTSFRPIKWGNRKCADGDTITVKHEDEVIQVVVNWVRFHPVVLDTYFSANVNGVEKMFWNDDVVELVERNRFTTRFRGVK